MDILQEELENSGFDIDKIINPYNLPGIYYICKHCSQNTIPNKETRLKASIQKKKQSQNITINDDSQESWNQLMAQNRTQPETSFSNDHESGIQDRGSERESNKQDEIISDDKMHQKKICSFYRKGNCKHGLRGNGCNYHHPPMCKKFINHGTRNPKGCNLGKNCENFHPKICSSSLTKSECFIHDCKFRHIKGTKRKKSQEPRKPNGNSDSKKENRNNEHNDAHF